MFKFNLHEMPELVPFVGMMVGKVKEYLDVHDLMKSAVLALIPGMMAWGAITASDEQQQRMILKMENQIDALEKHAAHSEAIASTLATKTDLYAVSQKTQTHIMDEVHHLIEEYVKITRNGHSHSAM